jgi:hypothetical protein
VSIFDSIPLTSHISKFPARDFGPLRGTKGVQKGYIRGTKGVQNGYKMGTKWVHFGASRNSLFLKDIIFAKMGRFLNVQKRRGGRFPDEREIARGFRSGRNIRIPPLDFVSYPAPPVGDMTRFRPVRFNLR